MPPLRRDFKKSKERLMYEDLLGKNREYVEAQLHDKIADKFEEPEERIRYKNRENLSITFYFDQNKVKKVPLRLL